MQARLLSIGAAIAAFAAAAWLAWPHQAVKAQAGAQAGALVNASGCSCSPPTSLPDRNNPQLSVYHCVCPGMQCVITAAARPSGNGAFSLVQDCAGPGGGGSSTVILPPR